jgi:surfeit locus 1 family protein
MPNPSPPPGPPAARRFRPRALLTIAAALAVVVFATAGDWQGRRMKEKEALRAQLDAAARESPVALASLRADSDWSTLRYRLVTATGVFDARRQVLVDNRVHEGRAGYHVVTPLALADGRVVLVNRGWTPVGASRAELPQVPPPAGAATVVGRLALPSPGFLELAKAQGSGPVWQNLDPARFAAATGVDVMPVMIEATQPPVPDDDLVRDWPAPDFGVEKHRIYMLQWYAFAALAVVLWAAFALRRPRRQID